MTPAALTVVLVVVVVGSIVALVLQRRHIRALEAELHAARAADDDQVLAEVITIQIRNHVELAASRSLFARPLGRLTPGLLRGIVHRETLEQMRVQMAEQGVDADVRLRRLPVRAAPGSGRTVPEDPESDDPVVEDPADRRRHGRRGL